ncbi:Uma2 family endonuclease [Methylomarinovum tepidoasis]|uniref:Uma2 family endonuclease n=1 Tax=Methylomarinovum tepidoasis TaxID=2840183 RepID=UPI0025723E8A|nr:Uma2 family endonuclease [Methylomarinovum sp. IN45]
MTFQKTLYQKLCELPPGLTGEIIDGTLYTQPRPKGGHIRAESVLDRRLGRHYDDGDGGPGGWWILVEPEVHFVRDTEVVVPDLAGWRRRRMPELPRDHRFEVVPDWLCEILSPATRSLDREVKMPCYARYGVSFLWLIDPEARTLEAFVSEPGEWRLSGRFEEDAEVKVAPFDAVPLPLGDLWR